LDEHIAAASSYNSSSISGRIDRSEPADRPNARAY
jgi:hypothetical protein